MIDSGATNNFLSLETVEKLALKPLRKSEIDFVRLANGQQVRVCGIATALVQYQQLQLQLDFVVLGASVPAILGMDFLVQVNPEIDWQQSMMKVPVGSRKVYIRLCEFTRESTKKVAQVVLKGGQQQARSDVNEFCDLDVEPDNVVSASTAVGSSDDIDLGSDVLQSQESRRQVVQLQVKGPTVSGALEGGVQPSGTHQKQVKKVKKRRKRSKNARADVAGEGKLPSSGSRDTMGTGQGQCEVGSKFGPLVARPDQVESGVGFSKNSSRLVNDDFSSVDTGGETLPKVQCFKNIKSCTNSSLKQKQCHVENGDLVQNSSSDENGKNSNNSSIDRVEMVNIKQFVRAGKKDQYEACGMMLIGDLIEPSDEFLLNFTHRSAHGNDHDFASHGKYETVAQKELKRLQSQYPVVFGEPQYPIDRSNCKDDFVHKIPLKDPEAPPPKRKLYPLDNVELEELKKQLTEFLNSNRIEPSSSPYGAPILFARKKNGKLRMCIDYRMLNSQTVPDAFPLPRIDELLQRLDGATIFSKLDLRDGYHQIRVAEEDQPKTAFTCRYGTYQFKVMPFGLMSAPATFQRTMNQVFFDLLDRGVLIYLDDVLIYSKNVDEHKKLLDKVFTILQQNKLYVKPEKCHLLLEQVEFLGHVVSAQGVSVEGGKIDAVKQWPAPTNLNQVQQFLGLCNYYRKFVCRFSEIASPLTRLTKKDQPFEWTHVQQTSFDQLKKSLCSAPTLKVFDPQLETRIICDASDYCVGSVLEQQFEGRWHPVEYFSKRLNQAERNYSATDREFAAIKFSLTRWRHFLMGIKFLILTDHAALTHLKTSGHVSRRNARWLDFLSQFDFVIEHVKGTNNVADHLSRIPGTEVLDASELCSMTCTCGVPHVFAVGDGFDKSNGVADVSVNAVISVFDQPTLLQSILKSQQTASDDVWLQQHVELAQNGSSEWQLRNGILCRLIGDHFCPVIPRGDMDLIHVILRDYHASALGGHLSVRKLLAKVRSKFYWQNMFASIDQFCRNCLVCQGARVSTQHPYGLLQPLATPTKPFEQVTMDFIFGLPETERGHTGIFTIVDRFSKYVVFIPTVETVTAPEVATLFFENWVCRFGMPQKIISDRDPRFQSGFWQSLMRLLGCKVAMSSAYHPETDGQSERFHRTLEQILRCTVCVQQTNWDEMLQSASFAINNTLHAATSFSANQVLFGFEPSTCLDRALQSLQDNKVVGVDALVTSRSQIHKSVTLHLERARQSMKQQADKKRRPLVLQPNDLVWVKTDHLPLSGSKKLLPRWAGPFRVEKLVGPAAAKVALPPNIKVHNVFHFSVLKPHQGQAPAAAEAPVYPVSSDQDAEFEVESILQMRLYRNKVQYLVKWKNYSVLEATWEPEEHLANAPHILKSFKRSLESGTSSSRRRGSVRK